MRADTRVEYSGNERGREKGWEKVKESGIFRAVAPQDTGKQTPEVSAQKDENLLEGRVIFKGVSLFSVTGNKLRGVKRKEKNTAVLLNV